MALQQTPRVANNPEVSAPNIAIHVRAINGAFERLFQARATGIDRHKKVPPIKLGEEGFILLSDEHQEMNGRLSNAFKLLELQASLIWMRSAYSESLKEQEPVIEDAYERFKGIVALFTTARLDFEKYRAHTLLKRKATCKDPVSLQIYLDDGIKLLDDADKMLTGLEALLPTTFAGTEKEVRDFEEAWAQTKTKVQEAYQLNEMALRLLDRQTFTLFETVQELQKLETELREKM